MPEGKPLTPEEQLCPTDPGDDTANRYRYQWAWAAVECCKMLDDTQDVSEVFCEHHEDVLIKHNDGKYTGVQVKTRDSDQPIWKAGDPVFAASCLRFIRLEKEFPNQFRGFSFLTNHPLYVAGNGQDITYVLTEISAAITVSTLPPVVQKWVRWLVKDEDDLDQAQAFTALKKTTARGDLPKRRYFQMTVVNALTQSWERAREITCGALERSARALVEQCGRASSLDDMQYLPVYINENTEEDDSALEARIQNKRMTKERMLKTLESGLDLTASLGGDPADYTQPGDGDTALLQKKLEAGGFPAVSSELAKSLRDKADYLGVAWITKYGEREGQDRYNHVITFVHADAARAFEATQADETPFGLAMKEDLRNRLRQRREGSDKTYDCSEEHLEGFAYSLTAQCKVQWSTDRPWEND